MIQRVNFLKIPVRPMALLAMSMCVGACARNVETYGPRGEVQVEYVIGNLVARLPPEIGVDAARSAAESSLRARGYVITETYGTRDRAVIKASGAGDGRRDTTTIETWLVPGGTKVSISAGTFGDETASKLILDQMLVTLGR